jgi:RNA polymerase sigma factor (sigma-70 family)
VNDELTRRSLLLRVRDASDAVAWGEFEARYRELITRYARAKGFQPADADDICQAVMAKLCRSLRGFEYDPQKGRFRTYLNRAVRNEIAEQFSRPKRSLDTVEIDEAVIVADDAADGSDSLWEREWENHHLRLATATIRETFDESSVVIFTRLLAGETTESVAQAYATTTQAVHKIKQRIRNRMHELIARQIAEEDAPEIGLPDAPKGHAASDLEDNDT